MHRISLLSLGLLLLALLTTPLTNPALAATSQSGGPSKTMDCPLSITVTSTDDSGADTLRQALADICTGGTIDFAPALSGKTIALASTLTIGKDLTIDGSSLPVPITISGDSDNDGDGDVRVFVVSAVPATLNGLAITHGATSGVGGGIANYGDLTLNNSVLANNSAPVDSVGGAIYNSATMAISGSAIAGNTAGDGGAILNNGTLSITDSILFNNSATRGGGGAIINNGPLTVVGSTFARNTSSYEGGGIFVIGGSATVTNSSFIKNNGGSYAGAIDIASHGGVQATVSNSTFSGNVASGMGGAIYNGGTLTLINSTFSANSSSIGSALMNNGALDYSNTLIANSVGPAEECTSMADLGSSIGTNTNNWVEDGSCSATMSGDPALDVLGDNDGPTQTIALLPGSGAINAGDDATCAATPIGNLDQRGVTRPVGAHCDIGAYEYQASYVVTKAADTNDGTCDVDCSLREAITAANANANIDAISFKGDYTIMLGSKLPTISDDLTINGRGHTIIIDGNQHAILENSTSLSLNHLTLQHASGNNGGALLAHDPAIISDVTFSSNAVNGNGGAIYAEDLLTINDSTFSSNSADSGGGAIENDHGTVAITNSTFGSNSSDIGGAIHSVGGSVTLTNSTLSGNGHSAIYNNGTLNYANTIIANSSGPDCENNGTLGANVNNLVEDGSCSAALSGDPALSALANNGGSTKTFALTATSSAVNAGNDAACLAAVRNGLDQRGYPRLLETHCDIGSYEFTVPPAVVSITRNSANPTASSTVDYVVTFSEPVIGVSYTDFSVESNGVNGAYAFTVSGGSTVYTVTVLTGIGSGTIKLNLLPDNDIMNSLSIPVNSGFTSNEAYTVDKTPPTVGNLVAADITASGGTSYSFSVTFNDNLAVDATSIDGNDIRVMGPGGFTQLATLVSVTPAGNGASRTAAYRINAPSGVWAIADNGVYLVALETNQVHDTLGNVTAGSILGTFNVSISAPRYIVSLPLVRR